MNFPEEHILQTTQSTDGFAHLAILNNFKLFGFDVTRFYVITALNNSTRGKHSHTNCKQALMAIHLNMHLKLVNQHHQKEFTLIPKHNIVFIPEGWEIFLEIPTNGICIAFATKTFENTLTKK